MRDLISRQGALAKIRTRLQDWVAYGNEEYRRGLYACEDMILSLPSAEAVEVVLCKDCKHHHYSVDNIPYRDWQNNGYGWKDDDYCSWGERREDGEA